MKQQTAVEWLVEQIKSDQNQKALSASEWLQVFEQAKQMEKEQIKHTYMTCWEDYVNEGKYWEMGENPKETFEQYYNETYKKQ